MLRFEFESEIFLWFYAFIFICVENRVCLSHGVQLAGAAWRAATRIQTRVGDLIQRTGDGQAQVGYSVAGRSGGRMMSCVICTMHMEMRNTSFLVEPQNQGRRFPDLGLKTDSSNLMILVSKSPRRFFRLCLKTKQTSVYWLHRKTDGGRTA
jgi:hypothetical protein